MEMTLRNVGFKRCDFNKETKNITLVETVFEKYSDGSQKVYEQSSIFKPGDDVSAVKYESFKSLVSRKWDK